MGLDTGDRTCSAISPPTPAFVRWRSPSGARPIATTRRCSIPICVVYEEAVDLIDDPEIEAVAIATPVSSHFELARRALARFKHVLVEKPMCASVAEGEELVALAERTRRTLMVDHTYLFHGAVQKLRELKNSGALGVVSYFDSVRINLGLFQPDMNVLWDLAPHDFSIMDYLFDEEPIHLEATGYCHLNPHLPDIAYITMHFPSRMIAHFHLSWMSPVKVRRIAVGGTNQMAVWDDLNQDEKLKIYDSGIEIQPEDERRTLVPSYRIGDVLSPRIRSHEPLAAVGRAFSPRDRRRGSLAARAASAGCGSCVCSSRRRPPWMRASPSSIAAREALQRSIGHRDEAPFAGHRRRRLPRLAISSTG